MKQPLAEINIEGRNELNSENIDYQLYKNQLSKVIKIES